MSRGNDEWIGWLTRMSKPLTCIRVAFAALLACSSVNAQSVLPAQSAAAAATFERQEGTDPGTGVRYVRLLLALSATGEAAQPARFTVECVEDRGKRDLLWFVSFGGIDDVGFVAPFRANQSALFPPQYPSVALKMTFEGYIKSKPFTRAWSVLPSGVLRYRNPGTDSPNMDSTRYFLTFLNSLPGLRIGYAKAGKGSSGKGDSGKGDSGKDSQGEIFFPAQPLLDELKKTPLCSP